MRAMRMINTRVKRNTCDCRVRKEAGTRKFFSTSWAFWTSTAGVTSSLSILGSFSFLHLGLTFPYSCLLLKMMLYHILQLFVTYGSSLLDVVPGVGDKRSFVCVPSANCLLHRLSRSDASSSVGKPRSVSCQTVSRLAEYSLSI